MREILFRAKRLDSGEWIKGTMYQISTEMNPFIMLRNHLAASYEVDSSTVGQFTGLYDTNDVRIFEGDIACFCKENQLPCYCAIKYGEYSFGHIGFYTDWYKGGSKVKYFRKDLGFEDGICEQVG